MELSFTLNRLGDGTEPLITEQISGVQSIPLVNTFEYKNDFSVTFPETSYPLYKDTEIVPMKIEGLNIYSDFKIDSKKNIFPLPLASLGFSDSLLRNKYGSPMYLKIGSFNIELPDRVLKVFGWDYVGDDFSVKKDSENINLEYSILSGRRYSELRDCEIYKTVYIIRYNIAIAPLVQLLGTVNDKPLMKAEFIELNFYSESDYTDFINILNKPEKTCYIIDKNSKEVVIDRNINFYNNPNGDYQRVFLIGEQIENGKFTFNINGDFIKILTTPYPQSKLFPRINSTFQNPYSELFRNWLSKYLMVDGNIVSQNKISYSHSITINIDPPTIMVIPHQDQSEPQLVCNQRSFTVKGIELALDYKTVFMDEVAIPEIFVDIPEDLTTSVYFSATYVGEDMFPKEQTDKLGSYGLTKFRFYKVFYLLKEPESILENGVKKTIIDSIPCFIAKVDPASMVDSGGSGLYDNYWLQFNFPIFKDGDKWVAHTPEIENNQSYPTIEKQGDKYVKITNPSQYPFFSLENLHNGSYQFSSSPFDEIRFKGSFVDMGRVWENFPNIMDALSYYAPLDYTKKVLYSKLDGRIIEYNQTNIFKVENISPQVEFTQSASNLNIAKVPPGIEYTIDGMVYTLGDRTIEYPQIKFNPFYSFVSAMSGYLTPSGGYVDTISVKEYGRDGFIGDASCMVMYDIHGLYVPTYDPDTYKYTGSYRRVIVAAKGDNIQVAMGGNASYLCVEDFNGVFIGTQMNPDTLMKLQIGLYPSLNKTANGYEVVSKNQNVIPLFVGNFSMSLFMIKSSDLGMFILNINADTAKNFTTIPPDPPSNLVIASLVEVMVGDNFEIRPSVTGNFITWVMDYVDGVYIDSATGVMTGNLNPQNYITMTDINIKVMAINPIGETSKTIILRAYVQLINFTYPSLTNTWVTGTVIPSLSPVLYLTDTGDTPTQYAISPALPSGLSFNTTTGVISGTPTASSVATDYTITASKGIVSKTITLSITVILQLKVISYPSSNYSYITGTAISITPTISGTGDTPTIWTVSPALPTGLSINPTTGVISGTPTGTLSSNATYTITASKGNLSRTLTITFIPAITSVVYNGGSDTPLINTNVSYSPVIVGGIPSSYTITPALPTGLSLNPTTGVISGTTPTNSNDTTYTITATNIVGSKTCTFRIRIVYVNTTMRVNYISHPQISQNDSYRGFSKGGGYISGKVFGSLTSDSFRGQRIHSLCCFVVNNIYLYQILFAVTGSFPNTDAGFFRQITFNGRVISRSNCYYADGFVKGYVDMTETLSNPPSYAGVGDGQTTQVIIE